jgi:uncharacterized membrane protein
MLWPLALAIAAGMILRSYQLGANSLWSDELATLMLARHPLSEIVRLSSSVNFIPPLYFLIVHGALQGLGESEVALRLTSAIAGLCTIPVVWLLMHELTGRRGTANIAAALLAVNPLHLWFSQEARAYALLLLFGSCTLLAVARAGRTGSWLDWAGFAVFGTLSFLTHTTGVLFGAVAWAWALLSPDRRRLVPPLLVSTIAAGLACATFAASIASALAETNGRFHSAPRALTGMEIPYSLFTYVAGFSFGPAPREIQNWGATAALRAHPVQTAVVAVVLLSALLLALRWRRPGMTQALVLLLVFPVGILSLSALSGKAYNARYTVPGVVGFIGVLSIAASDLRPRSRAIGVAALLGLATWADVQWFTSARYWKEDARAAVAWMKDNLAPGAVVAVAPGYSVQPLAHYARLGGADVHFLPAGKGDGPAGAKAPVALVLTRLHHVPDWRALRADFIDRSGSGIRRVEVVGYEILVRSPSGARMQR